jgi:hypothetical protein
MRWIAACIGTVLVLAATPAVRADEEPPPPSQTCTGGTTVVDGWVAGAYVSAVVARPDDDTVWFCRRVDTEAGIGDTHAGGRSEWRVTTPSPGSPAVDVEADACREVAKPVDGVSDPILEGFTGDPDDPTVPRVHVMLDADVAGDDLWVCADTAGVSRRLVVPLAGLEPGVSSQTLADPSDTEPPTPAAWPAAPSSACSDEGAGEARSLLNLRTGDAHAWASAWVEAAERLHLCVRGDDGSGGVAGGMLTIDAAGAPGISIGRVGFDPSPCATQPVFHNTNVEIRQSVPPLTLPTAFCVRVMSQWVSIAVDPGGSPVLPVVTWTPDPGTPGVPL